MKIAPVFDRRAGLVLTLASVVLALLAGSDNDAGAKRPQNLTIITAAPARGTNTINVGQLTTATATALRNNTSELSPPFNVSVAAASHFVVTNTNDTDDHDCSVA